MKALNFKNILIAAVATTGLVAGSAMAGPIVDRFVKGYDSANSGKATELAMFEDATGLDFADDAFAKIDGKASARLDLDTGLWVIDTGPVQPGYFLLKFGSGSTSTLFDTYVFKNEHNLSQLVWSNVQVDNLTGGICSTTDNKGKGKGKGNGNGNNCGIGRLSHVSYVLGGGAGNPGGNPGGEVPEPASLALLGAGLAGMALRRRRA